MFQCKSALYEGNPSIIIGAAYDNEIDQAIEKKQNNE